MVIYSLHTYTGPRGRRPKAPQLGDGREDHRGQRDIDEQGPGGDRGTLPLRHPLRQHRDRSASAEYYTLCC